MLLEGEFVHGPYVPNLTDVHRTGLLPLCFMQMAGNTTGWRELGEECAYSYLMTLPDLIEKHMMKIELDGMLLFEC